MLRNAALGGVFLVGAIVLAGWYMRIPALVQVSGEWAPVQPNAAVCLCLMAWGTFSQRYKPLLGSVVCAISGVALVGHALNIATPWIDELLITPWTTKDTSFAGRMAPNLAIPFFTGGIAIQRREWEQWGGAFAGALGLTALMGYAADVESAYGWGDFTDMALLSAVALVLASMATWRFDHRWGRYGLPAIIGAATAVLCGTVDRQSGRVDLRRCSRVRYHCDGLPGRASRRCRFIGRARNA